MQPTLSFSFPRMPIRILNDRGQSAVLQERPLVRWDRLDELVGRVDGQSWKPAEKARVKAALTALKAQPTREVADIDWAKDQGSNLPDAPRPWPTARVACLEFFPHRWQSSARQTLVEATAAQAQQEWTLTRELVALRKRLLELGAALSDPVNPRVCAFSAVPKTVQIKKLDEAQILESGPEHAARASEAYAIWMGAADKTGYLSRTMAPIGTAGARLFETLGAARQFAKKNHFGDSIGMRRGSQGLWRGPIAIVRLMLAPTGLEAGSAPAPEISLAIAEREAAELREAMARGVLSAQGIELSRALPAQGSAHQTGATDAAKAKGSQKASKAAKKKTPAVRRGRAWAQDGYALWLDPRHLDEGLHAGFASQRFVGQALGAAQLHRTPAKAHEFHIYSRGDRAVVRIRVRPVAIEETQGAVDTLALQNAISVEQALLAQEAAEREAIRAAQEALAAAQQTALAPIAPRVSRRL